MGILAKQGEKREFILAPAGVHPAVCFNVWDLGMQEIEWQGAKKLQHKIMIGWEIEESIPSGEYAGKRFCVYRKFTLSLGEKSALRPCLESWRGKAFTDEELSGFDVEKLIGVNCLLNIIHNKNEKGDKTYVNVASIMPITKGMMKMEPESKRETPDWVKKIQEKAVDPEIVESEHTESESNNEGMPF